MSVCVAAHCDRGDNEGWAAKKEIIQDQVTWPKLEEDADAFFQL